MCFLGVFYFSFLFIRKECSAVGDFGCEMIHTYGSYQPAYRGASFAINLLEIKARLVAPCS